MKKLPTRYTYFFHIFQTTMLCLSIGLTGLFAYSLNQPEVKTSSTTTIGSQTMSNTEPELTTLVDASYTKKPEPQTNRSVSFVPRHESNILKNIEFEQYEYVALLNPNDPIYPLWHLDALQIPAAWNTETGNEEIVIAVIDSGFALTHQELQDGWHINQGEQGQTATGEPCWTGSQENKQTNNCDDDQNGYIDDWRGWDFFSIDNSPQAGEVNPTGNGVSHGSVVAGLIGATADDGVGFPGVDWQAKIMPLQALSDNGNGYTSDIVAAVEYAVDNGADIINMSLGGGNNDPALQAAVNYAQARNVTVIAAAGNCASQMYTFCANLSAPGYMTYPAVYDEVISVGAVTQSGTRPSYASYGPLLDISAPGHGVAVSTSWSETNSTTAYRYSISGTSYAAPLISGIVGLMKANDPELTNQDIRSILRFSSNRWSAFSNEYGYGIPNAATIFAELTSTSPLAIGRSQNRLTIQSSIGEDPASPAPQNSIVTTTISSEAGDQVSLQARNISNGAIKNFNTIKLDDTGLFSLNWNTSFLGPGAWRITPNGLQSSGSSETIYISS